MAGLNLGNVYNKVNAPAGDYNAQEATLNNISNALQLGSKQIDTSGSASGAGQFAGALLQGAAQGFAGQAMSKKAEAMDAYNAWASQMQEHEQAVQAGHEWEVKKDAATKKAAIPAVVALTQYKQTGDKVAYEARLNTIADSFATDLGGELVNSHIDPNNDQKLVMTIKDADGTQDTQVVDIANLVGTASEINKDIGTQGMQALGFSPPVDKNSLEAKKAESEKLLGRPLNESEISKLAGIKTDASSTQWTDRDKAVQSQLVDKFKNVKGDYERSATLADSTASAVIDSGLETGFGTETLATIASGFGAAFGIDNAKDYATSAQKLDALLKEQVLPKVKALGAGAGISNADRDFAAQIIGTTGNTAEALLSKAALQRAIAENGAMTKQMYSDAAAGAGEFADKSPSQISQLVAQKEASITKRDVNDPEGVKAKAARYEAQYLQQYAQRRGLVSSQPQAQAGAKVKISNGSETYMVSPEDAQAAAADGFKVVQ